MSRGSEASKRCRVSGFGFGFGRAQTSQRHITYAVHIRAQTSSSRTLATAAVADLCV
ncbi:hypothetical protein L207DRAFT_511286 [Hyaloscypha variabilis F]|uniref:Uncharacterized protein n=1 Tax=Hyaloscypha variabilis (strain UAMH 11265 / GT02V1 / F) TaxID=1149755 RepID=A0A2J6RSJ7_HYAVF|nr:hypothetical protein L207DRAFT_511286 [Hyaloscypha variabilis F]